MAAPGLGGGWAGPGGDGGIEGGGGEGGLVCFGGLDGEYWLSNLSDLELLSSFVCVSFLLNTGLFLAPRYPCKVCRSVGGESSLGSLESEFCLIGLGILTLSRYTFNLRVFSGLVGAYLYEIKQNPKFQSFISKDGQLPHIFLNGSFDEAKQMRFCPKNIHPESLICFF